MPFASVRQRDWLRANKPAVYTLIRVHDGLRIGGGRLKSETRKAKPPK